MYPIFVAKPKECCDINGLVLYKDFITPEEESVLLDAVDSGTWNTTLSRRTQHFGFEYNYTSREAAKKTTDIPNWSSFVENRLLQLQALPQLPEQLIVNEYIPGQGIRPHIDSLVFADNIVSVSLGSDIIMDFINTCDHSLKKEVTLPKRSAILLHSDARYKWKHGITPRKKDHGHTRERRVSLTYRIMK